MPKKSSTAKKPGKKVARGVRITKGSKWTLADRGGKPREFPATVIESWSVGGRRIVLLSVPSRVREQRAPRAKSKKKK